MTIYSIAKPVSSIVLPIEQVFARNVFVPASVQRDYQWRTVHCLALLNDIDRTFLVSSLALSTAASDNAAAEVDPDAIIAEDAHADSAPSTKPLDHYMLGAIVLCPDRGRYAIYDGLQRLTTLTLLICVLRDLCDDPIVAARLDALVRVPEGSVRITLHGRDPTLPTQIQPRGESIKRRRTAPTTDMGQRIRSATQIFREKLKPWSASRRDAFSRFLLENVFIDVQTANDGRVARQMFVTTNTRGRSLDSIDLFKGQLSDIAPSDEVALRIVGHWNGLRTTLGDRLTEFLHCVDAIERCAPQSSDCLNALSDHLAVTRGPERIEAYVAGLATRAADYNAMTELLSKPPTDALSADIWRLQFFRWFQWQPLALFWFGDYRQACEVRGAGGIRRVEAARRRFAALHRRCMGLLLAGFSVADRETILFRALAQTKAGHNPLTTTGALAFKDVQLSRVRDALRLPLTDLETRSTAVRWLESMLHGDVPPQYVRDCTVEHVLPRRPAANSEWIAAFGNIDDRYFACHTLGNLVALDKVRNEKLRNTKFAEKLPVLFAAGADFKLLSDITLTSVWTAASIEARTVKLADTAMSLLDLPLATV